MNYKIILLATILGFISSCKSVMYVDLSSVEAQQPEMPLLTEKQNVLAQIGLHFPQEKNISQVSVHLESTMKNLDLNQVSVYFGKNKNDKEKVLFGESIVTGKQISVKGTIAVKDTTFVWVMAKTTEKPNLLNKLKVKAVKFKSGKERLSISQFENPAQRFGISVRVKKQDNVDCYRIPGLTTTNKGTLIAVYDNRYNNCKDLQEDIDVGMSRSTDGGQTWEPMKVIMDMKQWGGVSQELNGIGDPAVLVDKKTGTIWVAALWLHGHTKNQMAWWASKPGMTPQQTGQLMLVNSTDDGVTWSDPVNITLQTKNPEWYLFFNGPGSGISLQDGTIMFAAQYKDDKQVPHSTLIYSKDHGKTWHTGTGAKSHTTEAQVVQLSNGNIMLNMRDDRNRTNYELSDQYHGRSVAVTSDLGQTWNEHSSSRVALVEPNCMASIIAYKDKQGKQYLFFSNPADARKRINMTLKVSDDEGLTWDKLPQVPFYSDECFGYSCLSLIDNKYIGILYEGAGDLYFQKIPISELIK